MKKNIPIFIVIAIIASTFYTINIHKKRVSHKKSQGNLYWSDQSVVWENKEKNIFQPKQKDYITIMAWNVQNLFDTKNDPFTQDEEFTPYGKKRWNRGVLEIKIQKITKVISLIEGGKGPDILGLCEIENRYVLELLVARLKKWGINYPYIYHRDSEDPRGIDVAIISKYKARQVKWHPVYRGSRDILEAKFQIERNDLHIFLNHWRSRLGSKKNSEKRRIWAARKCFAKLQKIWKKDKDADIIIMGDFNDNPTNKSLYKYLKASPYWKKAGKELLYNLSFRDKTPINLKLPITSIKSLFLGVYLTK